MVHTNPHSYLSVGRRQVRREFGRRKLVRRQGPAKGRRELGKVHFGVLQRENKEKESRYTHTEKKVKLCENILIILQREIRDQLDRTIKLTKCRSHNFVDDIQIRLICSTELTFDRELDLQANYLQIVLIVVHSVVLHAHFFFLLPCVPLANRPSVET